MVAFFKMNNLIAKKKKQNSKKKDIRKASFVLMSGTVFVESTRANCDDFTDLCGDKNQNLRWCFMAIRLITCIRIDLLIHFMAVQIESKTKPHFYIRDIDQLTNSGIYCYQSKYFIGHTVKWQFP